jgi:hypothetical protein
LFPRSPRSLLLSGIVLTILAAGLALYFWTHRSQPAAPLARFGGHLGELAPTQQRLVTDWVERYSKATGAAVDPATFYDSLPLSTRTTFGAVTHALLQTKLNSRSGAPTGLTALDLVSRVETVAGRIPGKGGDKQFRIYVEARPDILQILENCTEFKRGPDNTVYHKGYPICFRSLGGTPSIQVSISRDHRRADMDVDYRSSSFPIMLVNGHLTASNSDVRAGDNDSRHNAHWSGLKNWWRGFMGLPGANMPREATQAGTPAVASAPRLGADAKPEDAIHDFLNAWLVEQTPGQAVGYVSPKAFACLELERGIPVDRGVARFQLLRVMQSTNRVIGKIGSVGEALESVNLTGPRGRLLDQRYKSEFAMYDVRTDLAQQFDCENRLHPEQSDPKLARSEDFGDYIGAVFRVKTKTLKGESVATVWAKDSTGWTLVSYDVEPEFRPGALPQSVPPESPSLPVVPGDPAMVRAAKGFLEAWVVKKDIAAASRYMTAGAAACYNIYRPENAPIANSPAESVSLVRARMASLSEWAGSGNLAAILAPAEPHHHDLKIVQHSDSDAFTIVSVPDHIAAAFDCSRVKPGEVPNFESKGPLTYGNHYAVSTRIRRTGEESAILWTLWSRQAGAWRLTSYLVQTP